MPSAGWDLAPTDEVRLRVTDGSVRSFVVLRTTFGSETEYAVRDGGGRLFYAAELELAEAIECATGVHAARAERLAAMAVSLLDG